MPSVRKNRRTRFRSTGSYEPDLAIAAAIALVVGFDPQALTSLTTENIAVTGMRPVSIHRLLRA